MTEKQAAINKAVRESILEALTNQGVNRVEAYAAALMGMYAVQADLNGSEFHLIATSEDAPRRAFSDRSKRNLANLLQG